MTVYNFPYKIINNFMNTVVFIIPFTITFSSVYFETWTTLYIHYYMNTFSTFTYLDTLSTVLCIMTYDLTEIHFII